MNNDIKFLNIEWRTPYPLTNFEDRFGLRASVIFLDSNMCGALFICTQASSQTLVVNYVNPRYFSLAVTALKPQQIPMFLHISARVWGRRWSPHTSEKKGSI